MRNRELDVAVGAVFQGRYRVLVELSRGGFGVVYKGEQMATGQHVAIKCLHRRGDDEAEERRHLARFRREAELCAQLHHPNIVRLIDVGQTDDGIVYTVFEFIPGANLQQVLAAEGALQPQEAKHLMAQVLDAICCAHARGIIHRDLKPGNIMIVDTGGRRNASVLDFGIGSLVRDMRKRDARALDTTVSRIGTPAYAAPEQLRGDESDESVDLYSWGLVFIECLTGRRAIPGDSIAAVIHAQLDEAPVAIPYSLSGHPLQRILLNTTAKNPANRRMSAVQLMEALEQCDVSDIDIPFRAGASAVGAGSSDDLMTLATVAPGNLANEVAGRTGRMVADAYAHTLDADNPSATDIRAPQAPDEQPVGVRPQALAAAVAERRQLTIVACAVDITSQGIDELDVEEYESLLSAHTDHASVLARRQGAYVARASGGEIELYFGYPRALGGDAARAARAAFGLIEAFAQGQRDGSARLRGCSELRIGIHTGLVLIQAAEKSGPPTVSVGAPRLAGQLSAIAPEQGVVVSDATYQLIRADFECESLGQKRVSSARTPLQVHLLLGIHETSRASAAGAVHGAFPLIGRKRELDQLHELFGASDRGRGHAVLLKGEAGIGKTRLIRELARQLIDRKLTWLEVQCIVDHENRALQPIAELMDRIIGIGPRARDRDKVQRLDEICSHYGLDPADAVPPLAQLIGVPLGDGYRPLDVAPARLRALILSAVSSLLLQMAARKPLVLVVEQLQWADPSTIEFLSSLLEELTQSPVFLLMSARAEFVHTWPLGHLAVVDLGALAHDRARQLALAAGGGRTFDEQALLDIIEHTGGVPLFIAETVRAIVDGEALVCDGGYWHLRKPLAELDIPDNLRGLLTARLDSLDADAKAVLQLASVLGRSFAQAHLRAACWLDEASLERALSRLSGHGPLQRRRRISGDQFVFKQALVHEAAQQSLPRSTRVAYHRDVADVLERDFPELGDTRPELLARLHAGAGQLDRALAYARRSALGALEQCAYDEAIRHAQQAMAWARQLADTVARAEAELSLYAIVAPALLGTRGHGHVEFAELTRRAEELIPVAGNSPTITWALWGLWLYHYVRSEYQSALQYAERLLLTAGQLGDVNAQVSAHVNMAGTLRYAGRYLSAEAILREGLALHDDELHGDLVHTLGHDPLVSLKGTLAQVQWVTGALDDARQSSEQSLRRAHELSHPVSECFGMFFCMYIAMWDGDYLRVQALADEMSVVAERRGLQQWSVIAQMFETAALGDGDAGRQALASFREAGQSVGQTFWLATIARSAGEAGDIEGALSLLDEAVELANRTGEQYYLAPIYTLIGRYRWASNPDDWAAAAAALRQAVDIADGQGASMFVMDGLTHLARVLADRQPAQAAQILPRLRMMYDDLDDCSDCRVLVDARAVLGE